MPKNPGPNVPSDAGKMGSASPDSKTLNVKVLSHANSLISNNFSCNRRYHAEGVVARSMERAAWNWNGEQNRDAKVAPHDLPPCGAVR